MNDPAAPAPFGVIRRDQILTAAQSCFLAAGYRATTIADIRRASGASTGSIYHFFAGKPDIAAALFSTAITAWSSADAGAPAAGAADPETALKASVIGLVRFGLETPALFRLFDELHTLARFDPTLVAIADQLAAGRQAAEQRWQQWVAAGSVRDLPWAVAHALILGPAYDYLRHAPPGAPASEVAEQLAIAAWQAVKA